MKSIYKTRTIYEIKKERNKVNLQKRQFKKQSQLTKAKSIYQNEANLPQ